MWFCLISICSLFCKICLTIHLNMFHYKLKPGFLYIKKRLIKTFKNISAISKECVWNHSTWITIFDKYMSQNITNSGCFCKNVYFQNIKIWNKFLQFGILNYNREFFIYFIDLFSKLHLKFLSFLCTRKNIREEKNNKYVLF